MSEHAGIFRTLIFGKTVKYSQSIVLIIDLSTFPDLPLSILETLSLKCHECSSAPLGQRFLL